MKNLPDDELFKAIEDRLRNYEESPDDGDWNKIAANIPRQEPTWTKWSDHVALMMMLLLMGMTFFEGSLKQNAVRDDLSSASHTGEISARNDSVQSRRSLSKSSDHALTTLANDTSKSDGKNLSNNLKNSLSSISTSRTGDMSVQADNFWKRDSQGTMAVEPVSAGDTSGNPPENSKAREEGTTTEVHVLPELILNSEPGLGTTISGLLRDDVVSIHGDTASSAENSVVNVTGTITSEVVSPESTNVQRVFRKKSGLSFYALVAPSLSYQHINPRSHDAVVISDFNSPSVLSSERLGYSIEAGVQRHFSKRLRIGAGLSYFHQSTTLSYQQQLPSNTVSQGAGLSYTIQPNEEMKKINYAMSNVGLNAAVLYTLSSARLIHSLGLGLQYDVGLLRNTNAEAYNNSTSRYLNAQVLYRVEYPVSNQLTLFVQPSYLRAIVVRQSDDLPFEVKQSRAAIGFGMLYNLMR